MKHHLVSLRPTATGRCPICGVNEVDDYAWCRPCIRHAAKRAAVYFMKGSSKYAQFSMDDLAHVVKSQANRWQKRFKRRLKV